MKVALINEYYGNGSTGKLVKELSEGLNNHSVKSKVFYAVGDYKDEFCEPISNRFDQKNHALLSRLTGLQGYFSVSTTKSFLKKLDQYDPDIIHLHNLHGNYINLRMLLSYASRKNKTVVITLHDCWFYTGKCTSYVPANCEKWKQECGDCPLLHFDNVNPTFFFDTTMKCWNDKRKWFGSIKKLGVIGVSEWVTKEVKQSFFKDVGIITTIHNWIDDSVFHYRTTDLKNELGLEDKRIVLMVSSNICEQKGYKELLYLSENLDDTFQVIAIGRNSTNLYIPDNVVHIERTDDQNKLAEFYSIADVVVNTTRYETFGMVTVEAMACGTPVIVYNNTASQDIVPKECGIVVDETKGFEEIVNAIKTLTCRGNVRGLTDSCQILGKYHADTAIRQHIDFYQTLIR